MATSVIKNSRKIFTSPGGDSSLPPRVTILENNEYKITYYEIISGTSGSVTLPTGATINAGEFGLSGNAILSKIDGSNKPTFESPLTAGGVIVTASLNVSSGAWVASGTYTDANVAIIYSIKIKAINYSNLTYTNIIGDPEEIGTEKIVNKSDSYTASSSLTYSSTKALVDGLALKESFQTLTATSTATPSITVTGFNNTHYSLTAQAVAITSLTIVGTPNNFDKLTLRITDNGVSRAIALGTGFIAGECVIPSTTKISVTLTLIFIYDSVLAKYVCVFSSYDSALFTKGTGNYSIKTNHDLPSIASGDYSFSSNVYNTASGYASTAHGVSSTSGGNYSFTTGYSANASGNYSFVHGWLSNASGTASHVAGGYANNASGQSSHIYGEYNTANALCSHAGGSRCIASAQYAEASGFYASSALLGEWSRSSGGNLSQYGINELVGVTTDATITTLYLGNNGSGFKFLIPTNSCYRIYLTANIRDTAWNVMEFSGTALIKNVAGTTSLVGTCTMASTLGDAALSACTIVVSADNTNDQLKVDVTGIVATTINWTVKCDYVKIK